MAISLDKIEREAPELVNLVKKSRINLDKHQLNEHVARVALMLDISGSMRDMYKNGKVDELVKRAMPLALQFDDDGQIDVFAFGNAAYEIGEYGLSNYKRCVPDIMDSHGINEGTYYEKALRVLDNFYAGTQLPVYVMFVTDGDTEEKSKVEAMLKKLSNKPLFIQFIAVGEEFYPDADAAPAAEKKGFLSRLFGGGSSSRASTSTRTSTISTGFQFLANLDNMTGRTVDNAGFFAIKHPTAVDDERLYALLMHEYPQWLKAARSAGILR